MKHLTRALLKLMTAGIPVVIAACYGAPYQYSKSGRVLDRSTHVGIPGIRIGCVLPDGGVAYETHSNTDGSFLVEYDQECAKITAEDVDGEENGRYKATEIPFSAESATLTVLMDKE
ncbi:MAG: hypothetical protein ACOX6T_17705 [Myxococcales bacterium]|jgi:hypothetical protein